MELAYNTRTRKAYSELMRQLEKRGIKTPVGDAPTKMNKWDVYRSDTVVFMNGSAKVVTYGYIGYAEEAGYKIGVFTPQCNIDGPKKEATI